jgi:hypothetical protein
LVSSGGEGEASSICVLSAPIGCFRVSSVFGDHPVILFDTLSVKGILQST